jgi:6-phosphogluconolactonase
MGEFLYVSLRKDNKILGFPLESGMPGESAAFAVFGGPAPMAVNPQKDRLFVGLRDSFELSCMHVLPDGTLLPKGKCSLPSDPCFVGTDRYGKYVFSSYYNAGQIAVHKWNEEDGSLYEVQRITTEKNAHSIKTDPGNRYAFAPHTGPNKIYLYEFDNIAGMLTPRAPPFIIPQDYLGPRHLCFHPFLDYLYVINEQGSSLSIYHFNRESGIVVLARTLSALPPEGCKGNLCAELRITDDGRFLYASNRGHDSIAGFKIDAAKGLVEISGFAPAPQNPRSFDISSDGTFLYAAGQDSGELAVYAVDKTTGILTEQSRWFIGNCPMWVMILRLPGDFNWVGGYPLFE